MAFASSFFFPCYTYTQARAVALSNCKNDALFMIFTNTKVKKKKSPVMGGGRSLYSPKKAARAGTRPLLFQLHRLFLSLPLHRWDAAVLKGWRGEKNNNLDARTTTAPPRPDGAASALFHNRQSILKRATGAGGRPAGRREREREQGGATRECHRSNQTCRTDRGRTAVPTMQHTAETTELCALEVQWA